MLDGFRELPNGVVIRPARAEDGDFLAKLRAATGIGPDRDGLAPDVAAQVIQLHDMMQEIGEGTRFPEAAEFVLERSGAPVGRLVLAPADAAMHILDLTVLPTLRGQGVEGAVVAALQEAAARVGDRLLCLAPCTRGVLRTTLMVLGFSSLAATPAADLLAWTPGAPQTPPARGHDRPQRRRGRA